MASGKLGEIVLSRKHYHGYGTNEVDRGYDYSCQYREKEKVGRDGYMIRDKDGRKDGIDDWCYSSSSGRRSYNNGSGRSRFNNKVEDREPGELSSGSGSEGSDVIDVRDIEAVLPPRKKQKFSPVVWDKEEKKVNGGVKRSIVQIGSLLNHTAKHPHQSPEVASPLGSSPVLPEECCRTSHQEVEQLEEDGFITGMNIPVSRWADVDEDEGNEVMCGKGKHLSTSGSSLTSLSSKLSPEVEEFNSENGHGSECSSQFNRINNAEVKEDDVQNKNTCYGYDTDSEEENEYLATPDPMSPHQGNMLHSSRSVHDFERLKKIGAGTYGIVYQCRDKLNGEVVALKKVKMEKEKEGFPMSSLREINILTSLRHPSIVEVKEVVVEEDVKYGKSETYLVMEYMEHDLKGLIEAMKQPFSQSEVKCLMLQLLEGVEYLHDNWVLHRDLKTSNLLLNNRGELKICDFGLSRQYGSPLKPYTPLVVTLWYRAPELLLGAKQYSTAIDMWSLGCIMAELLTKKPLFSGESEIDQLNKIFKTLGTPTETNLPGFSKLPGAKVNFVKQKYNVLREKFPPRSFIGTPYLTAAGFDLLDRLLTYDPEKRIKAADAVNHEWFREVPLPKAKEFMPTFPAQHDKSRY